VCIEAIHDVFQLPRSKHLDPGAVVVVALIVVVVVGRPWLILDANESDVCLKKKYTKKCLRPT